MVHHFNLNFFYIFFSPKIFDIKGICNNSSLYPLLDISDMKKSNLGMFKYSYFIREAANKVHKQKFFSLGGRGGEGLFKKIFLIFFCH